MKRSILIRGARQLLTLHGPSGARRGDALKNLGIIEDGSVLIVDSTISSVGPTRRIENLAEARTAEEINASGHVVMPGFVDSHTHLTSPPARFLQSGRAVAGFTEPVAGANSFHAALQYTRATPGSTLEFHGRKYLDSALRHGTTTMEAKTGYGLNLAGEMKALKMLAACLDGSVGVVPTFLGAHTLPPEFSEKQEYLEWLAAEILPKVAERKLARFVDVFCGDGGFAADDARPYLEAAARLGLGLKVHADLAARSGAVRLAVEMNATSADGLNCIEREDVSLLARSRTMATLLPGSVMRRGEHRLPPARELIDAGAAVAIASGFNPSARSTFNMQSVIGLACAHLRMAPEEAISAATINGAHAVGRGQDCGSLEFGKSADLLILNVSDFREVPMYFGCGMVALAMRKGQVLYREGAVTCAGQ